MNAKIIEIAERIRGLREILEFGVEEMAAATDLSPEEYIELENGIKDYSFTFLYKCSEKLGVDLSVLLTGENPKLGFYSISRKGEGLPIERRAGFNYLHKAHLFKNRTAQPFLVTAPFDQSEQDNPIHLSSHDGQEFNFVIKGSLKVAMEGHIELLNEGDSIYYDATHGHGMVAAGGNDCEFLAIVIKTADKGAKE
jgi:transcriptional regulator with XRE-family HTH domain